MALVLLPKPRLPSYWRVPALIAIFLAMFVVYHSMRGSISPDQVYADLVARVCNSVVRSPAEINGYLAGFTLGLRFLIFGTIVSFAVVGRGNAIRRGLVAMQALLYLFVMVFIDATLVCVEVVVGAPVAPTTLLGNFAAVAVAVLAMTRMQYANFAVPKPSAVPFAKRPRASDAATLIGVTFAAMAICMTVLLIIFNQADPRVPTGAGPGPPAAVRRGILHPAQRAAGPDQRVHRPARPTGGRPASPHRRDHPRLQRGSRSSKRPCGPSTWPPAATGAASGSS